LETPDQLLVEELLNSEIGELIELALAETRGRISGPDGAARRLGVPRTTLESKIKSLRIDKYRYGHSVRFLIQCESHGIRLINCPLFVEEWIACLSQIFPNELDL
jgi:Bacterial regulatory protein, Fis family